MTGIPVTIPFVIGQKVRIIPLENAPGRVLRIEIDRDGWQLAVRYFHEGKLETITIYPDEAESVP